MILEITKEKTYTPEFNGNKKLGSGEQIRVTYRSATIEIKERLSALFDKRSKFDDQGKFVGIEIVEKDISPSVFKELLTGIENCSYKDSNTGEVTVIRTAEELLAAPVEFDALKREISDVLQKEVYRKIEEKN